MTQTNDETPYDSDDEYRDKNGKIQPSGDIQTQEMVIQQLNNFMEMTNNLQNQMHRKAKHKL